MRRSPDPQLEEGQGTQNGGTGKGCAKGQLVCGRRPRASCSPVRAPTEPSDVSTAARPAPATETNGALPVRTVPAADDPATVAHAGAAAAVQLQILDQLCDPGNQARLAREAAQESVAARARRPHQMDQARGSIPGPVRAPTRR